MYLCSLFRRNKIIIFLTGKVRFFFIIKNKITSVILGVSTNEPSLYVWSPTSLNFDVDFDHKQLRLRSLHVNFIS